MSFVEATDGTHEKRLVVVSESRYRQIAGALADGVNRVPSYQDIAAVFAAESQFPNSATIAERLITTTIDSNGHTQNDAFISLMDAAQELPSTDDILLQLSVLQQHFYNTEHIPFVYATVDIVGGAIKRALVGDHEPLEQLTLPLKVLGELVSANTTSADYLASTVSSQEDLQQWLDLFSLPAKGWIGVDPPRPALDDTNCNSLPQDLFAGTHYVMSSVPCRLTGQTMAEWIEDLALFDPYFTNDPSRFAFLIKQLNATLPYSPTLIRRNVFLTGPQQLAAANALGVPNAHAAAAAALRPIKYLSKLGSRSGRNTYYFFLGKSNHRIDPLLMLFIFYYLETRSNPEAECTGTCRRIVLEEGDAKEKIDSKIAAVLGNIARAGKLRDQSYTRNGELKCGMVQTSHGEMFELMAMAYFHALYEFTGNAETRILNIERSDAVQLVTDDGFGGIKNAGKPLTRRADLVLAGGGDRGVHVELKSIQAAQSSDDNRANASKRQNWLTKKWPIWSTKAGKRTTYHRQFILDHVKTKAYISEGGVPVPAIADDFKWQFHTWSKYEPRRRTRNGKTIVFDPGVPMDRNGLRGDSDWDRVRSRLFQATDKKAGQTLLETTLGESLVQRPVNGALKWHHKAPTGANIHQHTALFDWKTLVMENAALSSQLAIPEEVRQQWSDIVNNLELQLVIDMMHSYEEIDVLPDINVDNAWDKAVEKLEGFDLGFSECDP